MISIVIFEIVRKCCGDNCIEKHIIICDDENYEGDYNNMCKHLGQRILSNILFPINIIDVKMVLKKYKFVIIKKLKDEGYVKLNNIEYVKTTFLGGDNNEKE